MQERWNKCPICDFLNTTEGLKLRKGICFKCDYKIIKGGDNEHKKNTPE